MGVGSASLAAWQPTKSSSFDRRTEVVLQAKVERFFQQHHGTLIKFFAARLHCVQDAKDVAQEAYAWLLQHQDDPRVVAWLGPINPLVYRVAWNIAGNRMLKHERHARLGRQLFFSTDCMAPAPEQVCAAHEDLRIIEQCLEELPPRCRMIFVLARLEDMSSEEIARRLDISVRSVYRHVDRALDHCLRSLNQAGAPTSG